MEIVDKAARTMGKKQYHIRLAPGDVGKYVLLPGDPARTDRVAKYLDDARFVMEHREHKTWTGFYKGIEISVTSTGMGCPSTAIAVEELINIGAECFIRIGSTGGLQPYLQVGDLVISTAAMKCEGTSKAYVPDVFPSVADFDLTSLIIDAAADMAEERDFKFYYGKTVSSDAFYREDDAWVQKMNGLGLLSVEMEASAIYTVCHLRGKRGAMISAVSMVMVDQAVGEDQLLIDNEALAQGWENEIQVALEAIYRFEQKHQLG